MSTHQVNTDQELELLHALDAIREQYQPPAGTADESDYLDYLHLLALALAEIEHRIRDAVDDARQARVPWSAIGRAMYMTKQGAQQRYGV